MNHSESTLLKSLFITGTDTDVGKTYITAGLGITLRKMGINIGVMKPFAAGTAQKKGYKSEDIVILGYEPNMYCVDHVFERNGLPYFNPQGELVEPKQARVA